MAYLIGSDSSGNGNHWTANNLDQTDIVDDAPTENFCTFNPLHTSSNITLSNGNLRQEASGTNAWFSTGTTIGMSSGKWYAEYTPLRNTSGFKYWMIGVDTDMSTATLYYTGIDSSGYGYFANNGQIYNNGAVGAYGVTYGVGDVVGIAFDADNGTLTYYVNGASQGTAFSSMPDGTYFFVGSIHAANGDIRGEFNFGQQPFKYDPPA